MSQYNSNPTKINAGFTFLSISVIGIVIATKIVKNPSLTPFIIVFAIIIGGIIAGMELALVVRRSNQSIEKLTNEERIARKEKRKTNKELVKEQKKRIEELRVAKYVAELFEEDIPAEEFE